MKRLILALALAGAAPAALAEPPAYDMVNLQADARAKVPNDLLSATLFVEMTNADAAKLATSVNTTLNQALKTAREFPSVTVSIGGQSTWPVYGKTQKLEGWRTRAELRLESKDFDAASRAIGKLQSTMQLGGLSFGLSPDTGDATENRLIGDAIKAFNARADQIASALGAKGWRTVNLNVGDGGRPMPLFKSMAMTAEDASVPTPEMTAGDADLSVNVNGTIQLQR